MLRFKDLYPEEIKMLNKCVLRFHKELGTLNIAKTYYCKPHLLMPVTDYLTDNVWHPIKIVKLNKLLNKYKTDEIYILTSVDYLGIIDFLIGTKNNNLINIAEQVLRYEIIYANNFVKRNVVKEGSEVYIKVHESIGKYKKILNIR